MSTKNKDWTGNSNSIYKIIGASNHTEKERQPEDYYATDSIAIDKLLKAERPYHKIWECACGEKHLSNRLTEFGYEVVSTDIIERGVKIDKVLDFLLVEKKQDVDFDILTNPPFKMASEFVLKALELIKEGHKVYMFLKLTFLEGKARYKDLFSKYPPKTLYVFSERILCAKNAEFDIMKAGGGSAVAYGWFVWEKGFKGKTTIEWI